MKVLLNWGPEFVELDFFDVEPDVLYFRGDTEGAFQAAAPKLSLSIKVGQRWKQWEEISCKWQDCHGKESIGLIPQWDDCQKKEFKKYLELTLCT